MCINKLEYKIYSILTAEWNPQICKLKMLKELIYFCDFQEVFDQRDQIRCEIWSFSNS